MCPLNTRKQIRSVRAGVPGVPNQQELIEKTEDRVRLRSLCSLLFKPPGARSPPNVPDQRPRATDIRFGTETQSRGSLHPVRRHSANSSLNNSFAPVNLPPPQALPVQLVKLRSCQAPRDCQYHNCGPFISLPKRT